MKKSDITIFRNVHKKPDDNVPDYRGYLTVDDIKYNVSLWINSEVANVPLNLSGQIELAE